MNKTLELLTRTAKVLKQVKQFNFSILTPSWSRYFYRRCIFDSVGKFDEQIFCYCKMMKLRFI